MLICYCYVTKPQIEILDLAIYCFWLVDQMINYVSLFM